MLPHLAALELGLLAEGMAAFNDVQPHWLRRIASQLGSLPLPEDDEPHRLHGCDTRRRSHQD